MGKKTCPTCGTENVASAKYCRICGIAFEGAPPIDTTIDVAETEITTTILGMLKAHDVLDLAVAAEVLEIEPKGVKKVIYQMLGEGLVEGKIQDGKFVPQKVADPQVSELEKEAGASEELLEKAATELGKNVAVWNNLGAVRFQKGNLPGALEAFQNALELDAHDPELWTNIGAVQMNLGNFEVAIDALRKALGLNKRATKAWKNLGVIFRKLRRFGEMLYCWEKAVEYGDENASKLAQAARSEGHKSQKPSFVSV